MNNVDYRDYQLKKTTHKGETLEWGAYNHNAALETDRPRLLMIGDSICGGYNKICRNFLIDNVYQSSWISSRGVTDEKYLQELDLVLSALPRFDYITFNNGLHCTSSNVDEWKEAYGLVIDFMRAKHPGVKIYVLTSTPVENEDWEKDVVKINQKAVEVAREKDLPVLDLHQTVLDMPLEKKWEDGVHYTTEANDILANTITDALCAAYGWTKSE